MTAGIDLWLATRNPKKAQELRRLLESAARIKTLDEIPGSERFEVIEDGADFLSNARKKAHETAAFLVGHGIDGDQLVLAEDSGLVVDALDGAPGVRSARYGGAGATDADRIAKLLAALDGVPPLLRTARFVCSLVVLRVDGRPFLTTEQTCEGRILDAPRGKGGFGYDPVFAAAELADAEGDRSFASLKPDEKDALSHRGKALRELARKLDELFGTRQKDRGEDRPIMPSDERP